MAVEELKARLTIDVSPFEAGSQRARQQLEGLERSAKQASGGVMDLGRAVGSRLTSALGALGGALTVTAAVAAFGAALKMGVAEVTEAERAVMKLTAVFDGQTAAVGRMTALAGTLAGKTLFFEDDQIQAAIATFKLFDVGEKEIQKLLPAVMDMATVMGMDLDQAVQKVSLGLAGQTRGLKQWGIIVQEGASAQDVMNAVLAKAAGFHDQAGKAGDTLTGKLAGLKKATHDAAESMTNVLKPTLETIVGGLTAAANAAKWFFDAMGNLGTAPKSFEERMGFAGVVPGSTPAGKVEGQLPPGMTPEKAAKLRALVGPGALLAGGTAAAPLGAGLPSSSLPPPRTGAGTGTRTGTAATPAAAGPGGLDVLAGDLANLFKRFDAAKQRYHDILVAAGEAAAEARAAFAGQLAAAMAPPDLPDVAPDFAKMEQAREAGAQRILSADAESRQIAIGLAHEGFERERAITEQWFKDESDLYEGQGKTLESLRQLRAMKMAEIGQREVEQSEWEAARQIEIAVRVGQAMLTAAKSGGGIGGGFGVGGAMLGIGGMIVGGPAGAALGVGSALMPIIGESLELLLMPLFRGLLEEPGEALDTSAQQLKTAAQVQLAAAEAQRAAADKVLAAAAKEVATKGGEDILSKITDESIKARVRKGEITAERGAYLEYTQRGAPTITEQELEPILQAEAARRVGGEYEYGMGEGYLYQTADEARLAREEDIRRVTGEIKAEVQRGSWSPASLDHLAQIVSPETMQAIRDALKLQELRRGEYRAEGGRLLTAAETSEKPALAGGATPPEDMSGRTPDRPLYVEVTNMPPANPFVFAPGSRFFRGGQDVTTRAPGGPQNVVTGSTGGRGAPASQVTGGTPIISRSAGVARSGGARR